MHNSDTTMQSFGKHFTFAKETKQNTLPLYITHSSRPHLLMARLVCQPASFSLQKTCFANTRSMMTAVIPP